MGLYETFKIMKRRLHPYRRLLNQYHRYIRKFNRVQQGSKRGQSKEWLFKRINRLRAQLMAYRDASQIWRRSLAAGAALSIVAPSINGQVQYQATNPNPIAAFSINADAHPVFVDFDGDGDDDFFLAGEAREAATAQEDALQYYRNDAGSYVRASGPFPADLDAADLIAEDDQLEVNPTFVDFDGDGDLDAFIGFGKGGIRYYRNDDAVMTPSPSENPFTADVDSAFVANSLSPAVGDVDGDGVLDLILGNGNNVSFFENSDTGYAKSDDFSSFSIFSDDSSPILFDFDEDGDLDMLVGNKYGNLNYFENNGGELTEVDDHTLSNLNIGAYIHPAFTDFDGDGDSDLILGSSDGGLSYFRNEGGEFERVASNELGVTNPNSWIRPALFDYDSDGDLDIFLGTEQDDLVLWRNDDFTFVEDTASNPFNGVDFNLNVKPTFVDYDGDGDVDLLATLGGEFEIYQADNGVYTEITDTLQNPFHDLSSQSDQAWVLHDVDSDGDLDAILGHKSGGIDYYENNGGVYTEPVDNPFSGIDVGAYSIPTFADYDDDGDMDLLVGNENGEIHVFLSDNGAIPSEELEIMADGYVPRGHSALAVGDLDGDERTDILVGTQVGELLFLHNTSLGASTDLIDRSEQMLIFPNPASDLIQVDAVWNQGKADLFVHDLNGKTLLHQQVFGEQNQLRVATLPKGVYSLELRNETTRAVQNLVVK